MTLLAPGRHSSHAAAAPALTPPPAARGAPYGGATILAEPAAGAKLLPGATAKAIRDLAARLVRIADTLDRGNHGGA